MRRYRKIHRRKNKRKMLIISIIGVITLMTAGYAAMQTNLEIKAKGNVLQKGEIATELIKNLANTNTNELYIDEHNDIRYYGATPNNYVTFNNELWRIIGIIDGKIKIIRDESIGEYAWNSSGSNNWNNSSLKSYLNGEYYNSIEETYRNMIAEETYYLGGATNSNWSSLTASSHYDVERSSTVYTGNPTSTMQYIGLMYPSDYGYAAGSSCLSEPLSTYSCYDSNYLFKINDSGIGYQWLQTPFASNSILALFIMDGYADYGLNNRGYDVTTSLAVFPVLYLKTEAMITDGDGSLNAPFELELD